MSVATSTEGPPKGTNLFIKAGPDGGIGDCPFSHKANLALQFRKVSYDMHPIDLSNKPQWFLDLTEAGSTPVYSSNSKTLTDSEEIIQFADKIGEGDVVLSREDDANWDKAMDVISPLLGSMAQFLQNKDKSSDADLRKEFSDALKSLNSFLESTDGPYVLGDKVSALDCNLAPKLKHISVAPKHFKNFEIPEECAAVIDYLHMFENLEEWKATSYTDDVIIWGWSQKL